MNVSKKWKCAKVVTHHSQINTLPWSQVVEVNYLPLLPGLWFSLNTKFG